MNGLLRKLVLLALIGAGGIWLAEVQAQEIAQPQALFTMDVEQPYGSLPLYVSSASGVLAGVNLEDDWLFNAEAGDRFSARVEGAVSGQRMYLRIVNSAGAVLHTVNGTAGQTVEIRNFAIATPGTYYLRILSPDAGGNYHYRVQQSRIPVQLEVEPNNSVASATQLQNPQAEAGGYVLRVAGALDLEDVGGDFYAIGHLLLGDVVTPELDLGGSATLEAGDLAVRVLDSSGEEQALLDGDGVASYTVAAAGAHFLQVVAANRAGGALRFADPEDVVMLPHTVLDGQQDVTVEFWWRSTAGVEQAIVSGANAGNDNAFLIYYRSNRLELYSAASSGTFVFWNTGSLVDGAWRHFSFVRSGTSNTAELFINGQSQGTRSMTMPVLSIGEGGLMFGQEQDSLGGGLDPNQVLVGDLDEVRIWHRALSGAEIAAHYGVHLVGNEPDLAAWWRFDEASGTTVQDSGPWGFEATLGRVDLSEPVRIDSFAPVDFVGELEAVYLLVVNTADSLAPQVVSTTLPSGEDSSGLLLHQFSVHFTEDLAFAAANNTANYELRWAGLDGILDTADDYVYDLVITPYKGGTQVDLSLADGSIQVGEHRFTVTTGILDRADNPLPIAYTQNFNLQRNRLFSYEFPFNDSAARATPLGIDGQSGASPSFNSAAQSLAASGNGWRVRTGDVLGNGLTEIVLLDRSNNRVEIRATDGVAPYTSLQLLATGANPWDLQLADLNGNGRQEIIVSNRNSHTLSVFAAQGDGTFSSTTYNTPGNNPCDLVVADYNGDGHPDVLVALRAPNGFALLQNDASGGLLAARFYPAASGMSNPESIAVADFDGDGFNDVALGFISSNEVAVYWGEADDDPDATGPTFGEAVRIATYSNPVSLAVGNFSGLGMVDLAVLSNGWDTRMLLLQPDIERGFSEQLLSVNDNNGTGYEVRSGPMPGHATDAFYVARSSGVGVVFERVDGPQYLSYNLSSTVQSMDLADLNGDGLSDLLVVFSNSARVDVFAGQLQYPLLESPLDSGIRHGFARGRLSPESDVDWWSFDAIKGDRLVFSTHTPFASSSSGLSFQVYRPDGVQLFNNSASSNGVLHRVLNSLPQDGRYTVRVARNWNYYGEYQFHVMTAPAPWVAENETNNAVSQSQGVSFPLSNPGTRTGQIFGKMLFADTADHFSLGFLAEGVQISVTVEVPFFATEYEPQLALLKDSTVVLDESAGVLSLLYTVPEGQGDNYHLRLSGVEKGIHSAYMVYVELSDTAAPFITGDTLPAEDSETDALLHRFTISVNKDLNPATVNGPQSWDLRASGPDGVFDTEDDILYDVVPFSNYSSGGSISMEIRDGPPAPGDYRFRALTTLEDLFGNSLAATYVRHFTVNGIDRFITEGRNNNTFATADRLSTDAGDFSQSFLHTATQLALAGTPHRVRVGDFDGDGIPDIAVLRRSNNLLDIFFGDGSGGFAAPVSLPTGANAWDLQVADLNADGRDDLAVSIGNAHTLLLASGNADRSFDTATIPFGFSANPREVAIGDLTGDGNPDIVVALNGASSFAVFRGDGSGSYAAPELSVLPDGYSGSEGIAIGDFDGDGFADVAVSASPSGVVVFWNSATTFADSDTIDWQSSQAFTVPATPISMAAADVDADGIVNPVFLQSSNAGVVHALRADGVRSFVADSLAMRSSQSTGREIRAAADDLSGLSGLLVSRDIDGHYMPLIAGSLPLNYGSWSIFSMAIADLDGDGLPDLILANSSNRLDIYRGLATTPMFEDPQDSGFRHLFGRGHLRDNSDEDFFQFSAKAGDRVLLMAQARSASSSAGLTWRVHDSRGNQVFSISGPSNSVVQNKPVVLTSDGTYYIRTSVNWGFHDEYHFRLTLVPAPWQGESKSNNTTAQADSSNSLNFVIEPGQPPVAHAFGAIGRGDSVDFFEVGNYSAGSTLRVTADTADFNISSFTMEIHRSGVGTALASFPFVDGAVQFEYDIVESGRYYVTVRGDAGELFSLYRFVVESLDTVPPLILADTLPEEDSTIDTLFDRFTLSFSEEMNAPSVNSPTAYDLRAAGPDGIFGTVDDEVYAVALRSAYNSGLTASYWVTDGPLQPGDYRFTVATSLTDLAGNPLDAAYVRNFSVENIPGYVVSGRNNRTPATATTLGLNPPSGFDGSFFPASGGPGFVFTPNRVRTADITGNGHLDLLVLNRSGNALHLLEGDGSGAWATAVVYATASSPWDLQVADLDGDGFPEVIVSNQSANSVSIFSNDAGSLERTDFSVGSDPRELAIGDLLGNGLPDVAVALRGNDGLAIMENNGDGTFNLRTLANAVPSNSRPEGIAMGDFNGDGVADIALGLSNSANFAVLYGTGGGLLSPAVITPVSISRTTTVAAADVNGDGRDDIVLGNFTWPGEVILLRAATGDAFEDPVNLGYASTSYTYETHFVEQTDGGMALLSSRSNGAFIQHILADGTFVAAASHSGDIRSIAWGDFNGDARPDLAVANNNGNRVDIYAGQGFIELQPDALHDGSRYVFLRGRRSSSDDVDVYKFSARAGEQLMLAADTPGSSSSSGLRYRLLSPSGGNPGLFDEYGSSAGIATRSPYTLPLDGTYYIEVMVNWDYQGEYRVRLNILPSDWAMETESNNNIGQANSITLIQQPDGSLQRNLLGYLQRGETRDVFNLGNLAAGARILASAERPAYSSLDAVLTLRNAADQVVQEAAWGSGIDYSLTDGADGQYYISVAGSPTGLDSVYYLDLAIIDEVAPRIGGTSLPEAFSTSDELIASFTLQFSETLRAATVNNVAHYDLRSAGDDGVFGTFDDEIVALAMNATYTSGTSASYRVVAGTLQPGFYRLTVLPQLQDLAGNSLESAFEHFFTIAGVGNLTNEREPNDSIATATPIQLVETYDDLLTGGGRGRLLPSSENDYWSFEALEGDRILITTRTPGASSNSGLYYRVRDAAGNIIATNNAENNGSGEFPPLTIPADGTYSLQVSAWWSYSGEYNFLLTRVPQGAVIESEPNNAIASATPLPLAPYGEGDAFVASAVGSVRLAGDLDYFAIGEIVAGSTVYLSVRVPDLSPLQPIVALYNASNQYQPEVVGGSLIDGVAEVEIAQTGVYFALVRAAGTTHGFFSQYVLDVQVAPTGGLTFPNLAPVDLTADAGPFLSGDTFDVAFRIENVGSEATPTGQWFDRVLLSPSGSLGDPGNLILEDVLRSGVLAAGGGYDVTRTVRIPDGIEGSYYVGVFSDATGLINEFLFEGDNWLFSENPVVVARRDYPDLRIENLAIDDLGGGTFRVSWETANRGTAQAATPFVDQVRIRLSPQQTLVFQQLFAQEDPLAVDAVLPRSIDFSPVGGGLFLVEVRTDAENAVFEYNAGGALAALQNNVATGSFSITRFFAIALAVSPTGAGSVSGGGSFPEGTPVTVVATPNTSTLPYAFAFWQENGIPRSTQANYTFVPSGDRNLTAVFRLPQYFIAANVTPVASGSVAGTGFYEHASTAVLTANPQPGYLFERWEVDGSPVVGNPLSLPVTGAKTVTAVFAEANPSHVVSLQTSPEGLTLLAGAGTYLNGEVLAVTAPASIESGDTEYLFQRWRLNGQFYSNQAAIVHTFTTLEPPTMLFVAEYSSRPLKPRISSVTANRSGVVPAAFPYQLTLQFDRAMDTAIAPAGVLLSGDAVGLPALDQPGQWLSSSRYRFPAVEFGPGNGGLVLIEVSAAQDAAGRVMDTVQPFTFTVDVTAPPHPVPQIAETSATTARFTWSGYVAPSDLAFFRIYLQAAAFDSLTSLEPINNRPGSARDVTLSGLQLDTPYHLFVAAVDHAGNMESAVASIPFTVASEMPAAVVPDLQLVSTRSARLDWSDYLSSGAPLGLAGFRVFVSNNPYNDVTAMVPVAELDAEATAYLLEGLDRSQVYHLAVVAFNRMGEFDAQVTTVEWSDPLSGVLTTDFLLDEPETLIDDLLVIDAGATLGIAPGAVLLFGAGAGLEVVNGQIVAVGTALDPIVFTSVQTQGGTPARGDWQGIRFVGSADGSIFHNVWLNYGNGLQFDAGQPDLDTFAAAWNELAGIRVGGSGNLIVSNAFLAFNRTGILIDFEDDAVADVTTSVIKSNLDANVINTGTGFVDMRGNWWGSSSAATIAAGIIGDIDSSLPLSVEPVLTAAFATADGDLVTGLNPLPLRLLSLNAESYRISEDSTFSGVLFTDVPRAAADSAFYATQSFPVDFPLTPEGGPKNLFVQFRSFSGELSDVLSLTVNYVTEGPVITAFNLAEGMVINRPIRVQGSATAPLGIDRTRLLVNGIENSMTSGGVLDFTWDIRSMTAGLYRVRFEAIDTAGKVAASEFNVIVQPLPPTAPRILSPVDQTQVNVAQIAVSGTAEPGISVRLDRGPTIVGTVTANPAGQFSFPNVSLVEGSNNFIATAFDSVGQTASTGVLVVLNTRPPSGLALQPPVYDPNVGTQFLWQYLAIEDRPTRFRLFIHSSDFSDPALALFSSPLLSELGYVLGAQLADGSYHAAVVGYDAVGNAGPLSARVAFTIDRTAPALTISFDRSSPVGPGPLAITLTSSEPLQGTPSLSIRSAGSGDAVAVPLTAETATRFAGTFPVSELSARSGLASFTTTARDIAGNRFNGAPTGPALVFDVTRPVGVITTDPDSPVATSAPVEVEVTLSLSKPPAPGTAPQLRYFPPVGDALGFAPEDGFAAISGDGLVWRGSMQLGPEMGNGIGNFTLNVTDAVGNVGSAISSGRELELYNTALPTPPARPTGLSAQTLPGGTIRIRWDAVPNAETYSIYRVAGIAETPPNELLIAGVAASTYDDLPPEDGIFSYIVTATRRGAEGLPSGILPGNSDRTPPPAPLNFSAALGGSGVVISWSAPVGGEIPHRYRVYRNDTLIRTQTTAGTITDSPPRGSMAYRVASVDPYGNEASTDVEVLDLFVGAVADFRVRVIQGNPPVLQWTRPDSQSVGAHIYRNGVRQTTTPVAGLIYVDSLGLGTAAVEYAIRAVNSAGQESAPKSLTVLPAEVSLAVNPDGSGVERPPLSGYFDNLRVGIRNLAVGGAIPLQADRVELERNMPSGTVVNLNQAVDWTVAPQTASSTDVASAAPNTVAVAQSLVARVVYEDPVFGSTVSYQRTFTIPGAIRPESSVVITMGNQPLAGGLTDFTLSFTNRSYGPVDFVVGRNFGQDPGDIYLSIQTLERFEVARVQFSGVVPGTIVRPNGDVVLTLAVGASFSAALAEVLIPESLGEAGEARFEAVANPVYSGYATANVRSGGPISGSRTSSLTQTPYYGSASTPQTLYSDGGSIVISGQALDRMTGDPVADSPLKIGFASRGYRWFEDVVTDENGDYVYSYEPQPGFSGRMNIWAAHPDVFDQLDQVEIQYLRVYLTPGRGNIVMSRSDTLDFSLTAINPGDLTLTNFTIETEAFILDGENEIPITGLEIIYADGGLTQLRPNERRRVNFRLVSALDLPDDPLIGLRLVSAEGAAATFLAQLSLRPAVAILTVSEPESGFVEVSVDRGKLVSREVTVINQGLRPLTNVKLHPPANLDWFLVNLEIGNDGLVSLPDIPVGGQRTFSVVFAPDENVELGFYSDSLRITGDNAQSDFTLNLFAKVTSDLTGSAQFVVDNIFGDRVPNARIRLRNAALRTEVGPINTDALGEALIEGLQEGEWSWQVAASGHSVQTGVVRIQPDQVAPVSLTLSRSLVTVNFTVVPKPFTDRYDIIIEQTFETRVPFPVLVLTPPHVEFSGVEAGFETIIMVKAKNEGLIRMIDLEIEGSTAEWGDLTPLITFVPELGAQEEIEVPFKVRFFGRSGGGAGGSSLAGQSGYGDRFGNCLSTLLLPGSLDPNFLLGLAALANANAESFSGALMGLAASLMIGFDIFNFASTWANPLNVLATVVGCAIGSFYSGGPSARGGGPGGGGGYGFYGLGCFSGDTPVLLASGESVPIALMESGMQVQTDKFGRTASVGELIERESANLYHLYISGPRGMGEVERIRVTGEHQIWTDDSGWMALQQLQPGQWLHHADGSLRQVVALDKQAGTHRVFTLELKEDNAFFAGGILVQDNCGGAWSSTVSMGDTAEPESVTGSFGTELLISHD